MIKIYILSLFFTTFTLFAQNTNLINPRPGPIDNSLVVFKYDDSGNQIYRGPKPLCLTCREGDNKTVSSLADQVSNKIQAVPVPVKTDLTVIWDLSIKDYIVKIDLLPYNSFNIMASVNIKSLSDNSYVFRMGSFPYGVYYLKFYLLDGSVYTRTITKN